MFESSDDDHFAYLEIRKHLSDVLADFGCFRQVFDEKAIVAESSGAFVIICDKLR